MPSIDLRGKRYRARIHLAGHPLVCKTFDSREEATLWSYEEEARILALRPPKETKEERLRKSFPKSDWPTYEHPLYTPLNVTDAQTPTLGEALSRYASEVSPTKKGERQEIGRIRSWMKNPLASFRLAQIKGMHLAQYKNSRLAVGIAGSTLQKEFALISHLYRVAQTDWGFDNLANPVKTVRKPKIARGRDRRLRGDEEATLLDYCDRLGKKRLKAAIILAVETAMRRSELTRLKWRDVDLHSCMAYLHDTKNGERRVVPLSSRAVAAFRSIPKTSTTAILNVHYDRVTSDFKEARDACDIQDLRFHDLRHEATSRLFEKGFNMMEVSTITGHKSLSMLKRYTHLNPLDLLHRLG